MVQDDEGLFPMTEGWFGMTEGVEFSIYMNASVAGIVPFFCALPKPENTLRCF